MPAYRLKYNITLKKEVFSHYGNGKLECPCGQSDLKKLALDHINNDGAIFRRLHKISGNKFYQYLKRENFPNLNLQILCHNCNILKQDSKPRNPKWAYTYLKRDRLKIKCFAHYAEPIQCAECATSDLRVLTLDHIEDDGGEFRKLHNISGGNDFYLYLSRNNYPDLKLQVLCFNCNQAKMIDQRKSVLA